MYRAIVVLLAVGGCGRRDFDARVDAADDAPVTHDATFDGVSGHDEDGDGFADSIAPCPHVAGDLTDTDGDGVGDACDPNPATATEHWVLFATMQAGDTAYDDITGATQEADSLRFVGDNAPYLTFPIANARIQIGWEVHALVGTGQHQVAFGVDNTTQPVYYFGELNQDSMNLHDAAIVSYDSVNQYQTLAGMDPGAFHAGVGLVRMDVGTTHYLRTGWTGQMYEVKAETPMYQGGQGIRTALNGIDISIDYLAIIAAN